MLDFVIRPIRSVLGVAEQEVEKHSPLEETREIEAHILEAVTAIHRATDSIEQHVEVIETLATSVTPLTESVNHLTDTMRDLVVLLAPMAAAEREVSRVRHLFGRRQQPAPTQGEDPDAS